MQQKDNYNYRIAIIGCGGVVQNFYLPAFKQLGIQPCWLIDKNIGVAQKLAHQYQVEYYGDDYVRHLPEMDAAIVATPNCFHAPIAMDLLQEGIHIMVEKPMALHYADCKKMMALAQGKGLVLAVGLMRRYFAASQWMKQLLKESKLGNIERFDFREGNLFNWPVQSPSFFDAQVAGGGVLADTGAHTLDLLLWWLGEYEHIRYADDNFGGIEADAVLHIKMKNGAEGRVELSRTRTLSNTAIIQGSKGEVVIHFYHNTIQAKPNQILNSYFNDWKGSQLPQQTFRDLFVLEIKDWLTAIGSRLSPLVAAQEAAESVKLIEDCYHSRQSLKWSWI